jgi:putative oxidoreductase
MSAVHQLEAWSTRHNPKWLVVLRAGLGFCLFIKGIHFIYNSILLDQIFAGSAFLSKFSWLSTTIPYIHLLGGALLIIGLFTRFICLVHIPILLGAIFFVNMKQGFFSGGTDLPFSILILLFLCFFPVEGGGYFSLDHRYFSGHAPKVP